LQAWLVIARGIVIAHAALAHRRQRFAAMRPSVAIGIVGAAIARRRRFGKQRGGRILDRFGQPDVQHAVMRHAGEGIASDSVARMSTHVP
jgi:hypothetical protein